MKRAIAILEVFLILGCGPLFAADTKSTINSLTGKTTPASTDKVPIWSVADGATQAFTLGNLAEWRTTNPSANGLSLVSADDYAAMRGLLDLEAGTDFNAYDADYASLAAGITGLVKGAGNGGGYSAASAGTDYVAPSVLTALGIASGAEHFGTFTGSTIADSATAKAALQALETAVEGKQATDADLSTLSAPGNWKVVYSDGSGVVQTLSLGDSGKVLTSNGTTSAPTFETPAGGGDMLVASYPNITDLESLATTGGVYRTADHTWATRTITGTANQITVTNGNGVSDNPTISLPSAITLPGSLALGGNVAVGSNELQSTGNIVLQLGDNAGSNKFSIQDSDSTEVFAVDSNGGMTTLASTAPTILLRDSDNAAGTGAISANSSGGPNDIILSIGVEDSTGESTEYVQLDGVAEDVEIKKPLVCESTVGVATSLNPDASGGADLGTTALEWGNGYFADGKVLYFGNDQDVSLTHVADTGLLLNAAMVLQFRDSAISIGSGADGHLDLTADTSIDLNGPVDLVANNLTTTGTIRGRTVYGADVTGNASHDTTALHNVIYHVTAAATITLDAAADAGYGATVSYRIRDASETCLIETASGEKINLAGTALATGTGITATGAGKFVTLVATTDTDASGTDGWEVWGNNGFASE